MPFEGNKIDLRTLSLAELNALRGGIKKSLSYPRDKRTRLILTKSLGRVEVFINYHLHNR